MPVRAGLETEGLRCALYCVDFLITFGCYGSHLRGDEAGSFDHIRGGERRFLASSPELEAYGRRIMRQAPYLLATPDSRCVVREAIPEVCRFRSWQLYALHVRANHVHGIVRSDAQPSRVMNEWKAYATRRLRSVGVVARDRLVWAHGGNVAMLGSDAALHAAIRYVLEKQGEPWRCIPRKRSVRSENSAPP